MSGAGAQPSDADVSITVSDDWVVARDEETGVTTQGETRAEAIENLGEALRLYHRPVAEENEPEEPSDAPWL